MKLNLNQQKYIIPIVILPFLFLGFYLYRDTFGEEESIVVGNDGMQESIGEASQDVRSSELTDKLTAYQQRYREADGYTAITGLGDEDEQQEELEDLYSRQEKASLDSLEKAFKKSMERSVKDRETGYRPPREKSASEEEKALIGLLNSLGQPKPDQTAEGPPEQDPMEMMRMQYLLMDSLQKANDPEHRAEQQRREREAAIERERERMRRNRLTVQRAAGPKGEFNTIKPERERSFIKAILDENITGYADSRIRIRLLEDITVGEALIKKGAYLYALINGFSGQRVTLAVTSVMHANSILPINLSIYDMDGMEGLYVPQSAFREFTKELGASSMQGVNISQNPQNQSEFLMSALDKAFSSTSTAISNAIRKNKAKLKYNTYIYLIDKEELQK